MKKGTLTYFEATPEKEKVDKLIEEFNGEEEKLLENFEKGLLQDFIWWLYEEKKCMIIPQELVMPKNSRST